MDLFRLSLQVVLSTTPPMHPKVYHNIVCMYKRRVFLKFPKIKLIVLARDYTLVRAVVVVGIVVVSYSFLRLHKGKRGIV